MRPGNSRSSSVRKCARRFGRCANRRDTKGGAHKCRAALPPTKQPIENRRHARAIGKTEKIWPTVAAGFWLWLDGHCCCRGRGQSGTLAYFTMMTARLQTTGVTVHRHGRMAWLDHRAAEDHRSPFEPRTGEILVPEYWCSSGFANTDLDHLHRGDRSLCRRARLRGHGVLG